MVAAFLTFLEKQKCITNPQQVTLLAVSGGVDSVVLCRLFQEAALPFAIAHCHFNLRGSEADAACQLVERLAQKYQVAFYHTKFDTRSFASQHKISIQMAARNLRYQFFHQLLTQHGLHYIATAHHWDDAAETILLNFTKGTGIKGLYGISFQEGVLIRPLLFARKAEIIAFAKRAQLTWQEDRSNQCLQYQRNFIRHRIMPVLHGINPNFETTLQTTQQRLKDTGKLFEHYLTKIKSKIHHTKEDIHYIAIGSILALPWATTLAFELVQGYGFTFKQIKQLLEKPMISGKKIYAPHYTLYVDRSQWLIQANQVSPALPTQWITSQTTLITFPTYTLHCQTYAYKDYILPKIATIAALDHATLRFPLAIRPWQAGDFFRPLGGAKKKVSDFLIACKIPLPLKKQIGVITSQGEITWVIGHRIDQRFKITEQTEKIMEIKIVPQDKEVSV